MYFDGMGWVLLILIAIPIYMLPAIIAESRGHPNKQSISAMNAVAGWTVVGWIACLVWALSDPKRRR